MQFSRFQERSGPCAHCFDQKAVAERQSERRGLQHIPKEAESQVRVPLGVVHPPAEQVKQAKERVLLVLKQRQTSVAERHEEFVVHRLNGIAQLEGRINKLDGVLTLVELKGNISPRPHDSS